ncbi:SCP-like extracellular protein [Thelonectria olida]|uniref:SCP-like extracellular protein n=1 Tax=Thelonectria olida TaxID=1576542 RepID=A0A9P9AS35_9HYPO|nr:SCP-like extracellular protein [Thelonectria olida]
MHFSSLVVSMLVANAAAWRWSYEGYGSHHWQVTTITKAATVTHKVTATAAVPVQATTLVTKKITTTTAAAAVATTAAASSGSSSSSLTTDQQNALDAHNAARAEVGTADLTWDDSLASDAQEWATHLASLGSLTHSTVEGQGENLYMQSGTDAPYLNAVNAFVSEKSSYNGEAISETNYQSFGHYTQVVWKSTTKVGMAIASGNAGTFVVARYSPPGNYIGETAY